MHKFSLHGLSWTNESTSNQAISTQIESTLKKWENPIARAKWNYGPDYLEVIEIYVGLPYRRCGVATHIYDWLRHETQLPLKLNWNALASREMKLFVVKYLENHEFEVKEGGSIIIILPERKNNL